MQQLLSPEKERRSQIWEHIGHGTGVDELFSVMTYTLNGINQGYIVPTWRHTSSRTPVEMIDVLMISLQTLRATLAPAAVAREVVDVTASTVVVETQTGEQEVAPIAAAAEDNLTWQATMAQICIRALVAADRPLLNVATVNYLFLLAAQAAGLLYVVPREVDLIPGYIELLVQMDVIKRPRSLDLSGEANKPLNSLVYGHPEMIERVELVAPAGQHRKTEHGYRISEDGVPKVLKRLADDGLSAAHVNVVLDEIRVRVIVPPELSDEQSWNRRFFVSPEGTGR